MTASSSSFPVKGREKGMGCLSMGASVFFLFFKAWQGWQKPLNANI
jgi:hypothetical protein